MAKRILGAVAWEAATLVVVGCILGICYGDLLTEQPLLRKHLCRTAVRLLDRSMGFTYKPQNLAAAKRNSCDMKDFRLSHGSNQRKNYMKVSISSTASLLLFYAMHRAKPIPCNSHDRCCMLPASFIYSSNLQLSGQMWVNSLSQV